MTGSISPTATLSRAEKALTRAECYRCEKKLGRGRYVGRLVPSSYVESVEIGGGVIETVVIVTADVLLTCSDCMFPGERTTSKWAAIRAWLWGRPAASKPAPVPVEASRPAPAFPAGAPSFAEWVERRARAESDRNDHCGGL